MFRRYQTTIRSVENLINDSIYIRSEYFDFRFQYILSFRSAAAALHFIVSKVAGESEKFEIADTAALGDREEWTLFRLGLFRQGPRRKLTEPLEN